MKKTLLFAFAFASVLSLNAQEFVPLQMTSGYNADVIANGLGPSLLSTTSSFDNAAYVLMSTDFQASAADTPPAYALPASGLISSPVTPGLSYQLAPYTAENVLRLQEQTDWGSFVVANGAPSTTLYVLAATGSGTATLGGTIHFSDNSTQAITSGLIPDWFFSNALPVEISGIGRVGTDTDVIENPADDPRLYQYQIAIAAANQTKTITSIDFIKESAQEGALNIFAVSARTLGSCPAPIALSMSNVGNTTAILDYTPPPLIPTDGYDYYLATDTTAPTAATMPTGSTANPVIALSGLSIGQSYCIWMRSRCGESVFGPWSSSICFTTGQIPTTSPDGIPTLYSTTVDLSSATTCPGTLTVNVPAGFVISSVATNYQMQTALNGWMSEQRSVLVCNTTGLMEPQISSGIGGMGGTFNYSRTGLSIANGATGAVEFELRAWRTFGGSGCTSDYNRVVAGSWTVTVTLQETLAAQQFAAADFAAYPNPANDIVHVDANQDITALQLYNLLGQQVWAQTGYGAQRVHFSTANLPKGQYLLTIKTANGTNSKMIVKQ